MQVKIHKSFERGTAEHGWLHSRFSFSFADYYNQERLGFGALLALNDDIIGPASGFGMHSHSDMEIVTIVLEGELMHEDSARNKGVLKSGQVQKMTAGSGIMHSETNPSKSEKLRLLQVWVLPKKQGLKPSYELVEFSKESLKNRLLAVASGKKSKNSALLYQDSAFFLGMLEKGKKLSHKLEWKNNGVFVFLIEGAVEVLGKKLSERDSAEITGIQGFEINALEKSFVLLIEVPMIKTA